eukprot:scaffold24300_cov45-Isochrysis_galbana.AAC.1
MRAQQQAGRCAISVYHPSSREWLCGAISVSNTRSQSGCVGAISVPSPELPGWISLVPLA